MHRPDSPAATFATVTLEQSPVGPLSLIASAAGLCSLRFGRIEKHAAGPPIDAGTTDAGLTLTLTLARDLLERYFRGDPVSFDELTVDFSQLTTFQRATMEALRSIDHGRSVTYGQLARDLGCGSARAVGQAVGANPIPVIVPCHRVLAHDGRLGGFSGGLPHKVTLLELEGFSVAGGPLATSRVERRGSAVTASRLENHLHG